MMLQECTRILSLISSGQMILTIVLQKIQKKNLLIVNDQMEEAGSSKTLQILIVKGSHNRNITIMYFLQNMYNASTSQQTESLYTHYMAIFKNPRDARQLRV